MFDARDRRSVRSGTFPFADSGSAITAAGVDKLASTPLCTAAQTPVHGGVRVVRRRVSNMWPTRPPVLEEVDEDVVAERLGSGEEGPPPVELRSSARRIPAASGWRRA